MIRFNAKYYCRVLFTIGIFFLTQNVLFASVASQVRAAANDLAKGYKSGRPGEIFRSMVGVAIFENRSEGAKKHSVGELFSSLILGELKKTTVFDVLERDQLNKILKEYELSMSGLTDTQTVPQIGNLKNIDALVLGEVTESAESFHITMRIVDLESGRVLATHTATVSKSEIIRESEEFKRESFQSRYGISFEPYAGVFLSFDGNSLPGYGIDMNYKVTRGLRLSIGIASYDSIELKGIDQREINQVVLGTTYTSTRYFRMKLTGLRLGIGGYFSPAPWLNIGGVFRFVSAIGANLQQDMTDFPVWGLDLTGSPIIETKRIIIDGYSHKVHYLLDLALDLNFLISRRMSVNISAGLGYMPRFIPQFFASAGKLQDNTITTDSDIDRNGTFSEYQNFNFSRNSKGERIGFGFTATSIQVSIALHI